MVDVELRDILRDARIGTGHTQASLARALGVGVRTLRGWERGECSPTWELLSRWGEAVRVSIMRRESR